MPEIISPTWDECKASIDEFIRQNPNGILKQWSEWQNLGLTPMEATNFYQRRKKKDNYVWPGKRPGHAITREKLAHRKRFATRSETAIKKWKEIENEINRLLKKEPNLTLTEWSEIQTLRKPKAIQKAYYEYRPKGYQWPGMKNVYKKKTNPAPPKKTIQYQPMIIEDDEPKVKTIEKKEPQPKEEVAPKKKDKMIVMIGDEDSVKNILKDYL